MAMVAVHYKVEQQGDGSWLAAGKFEGVEGNHSFTAEADTQEEALAVVCFDLGAHAARFFPKDVWRLVKDENDRLAEFFADVRKLMIEYTDEERAVIAELPFAASLDQLAVEKYGVSLKEEQ